MSYNSIETVSANSNAPIGIRAAHVGKSFVLDLTKHQKPNGVQKIFTNIPHDAARKLRDILNEAYPTVEENKRVRPHGPQEYKGNLNHSWEMVTGMPSTQRLRVPGGWLYRTRSSNTSDMSFVPVPEAVGYPV